MRGAVGALLTAFHPKRGSPHSWYAAPQVLSYRCGRSAARHRESLQEIQPVVSRRRALVGSSTRPYGIRTSPFRNRSTLALLLALACSPDKITGPSVHPPEKMSPDGAACEAQIIPDPSCTSSGGGGTTERYYSEAYGSLSFVLDFTVASPPENAICPKSAYLHGYYGSIDDVDPPLPFLISGLFTLMPGHAARYEFPPGWVGALDNTGRRVSIEAGDAVCRNVFYPPNTLRLYVDFYKFYGVRISTPISGGSGGDGGSGGSNCETQFITVQVDNGSGWQDWWSGYASVCT